MKEVDAGFVEVKVRQLLVFFTDESFQTFYVEDGAKVERLPEGTEGTPAFIRITHKDGDVEEIYMHHVIFMRDVVISKKKKVSVPVDDTTTPRTAGPHGTSHDE